MRKRVAGFVVSRRNVPGGQVGWRLEFEREIKDAQFVHPLPVLFDPPLPLRLISTGFIPDCSSPSLPLPRHCWAAAFSFPPK
ncbi:hypothetical protein SLEP1_g31239 [Rubroshorea leprosula]|uniref:Uncharacterized protein n=1 Tax=Rubroshorea leprosula TaxID=152421 RepID=A0AAV5K9K3_9ROSI|nr:hypothetical protein SLEP1_g31239 [Rubroshorea leprosula]